MIDSDKIGKFVVCVLCLLGIFLICVLGLRSVPDKVDPLIIEPTPPKPEQPVYILITCPKVGGDYVYEITEDLKLRYLAGES